MKFLLHILKYCIPIFLALDLDACAPYPHNEVYLPAINGKLHRNGDPVSNATVYYEAAATWNVESFGEKCRFQNEEFSTQTNSNGEFHFEAKTSFKSFSILYVPGGHWDAWQICIADGDARYQGWYERIKGPTHQDNDHNYYSADIALDCNLKAKPHEEREDNIVTKGICTISKNK